MFCSSIFVNAVCKVKRLGGESVRYGWGALAGRMAYSPDVNDELPLEMD